MASHGLATRHSMASHGLAHLKTLQFSLIIRPLHLYLPHRRRRRPLMGPGDQQIQGSFAIPRPAFPPATGQVTHPSSQSESPRLLHRRVAEANALDLPTDNHSNLRLIGSHRQAPSSIRASSSSSITLTPGSCALRELRARVLTGHHIIGLAADRAETRPPAARIFCSTSERLHLVEPAGQHQGLVAKRAAPVGLRERLEFEFRVLQRLARALELWGSSKYSRMLRATSGPMSRTAQQLVLAGFFQALDDCGSTAPVDARYVRRRGGYQGR